MGLRVEAHIVGGGALVFESLSPEERVKYNTPEDVVRTNHLAARPRTRLGFGLSALGWLIAFAGVQLDWQILFWLGGLLLLAGVRLIVVTWYRVLTLQERPRG